VYDRDVKIPAIVVGKRGAAPDTIVEGERITVGTWELISYPQVRFSQVKERRFNLIDRAQQRAKLDLMAEEDKNIFNAVDVSSTSINPITNVANSLSRDAMVTALAEVGKWDLVPQKFVMNYSEYADLMKFGRDYNWSLLTGDSKEKIQLYAGTSEGNSDNPQERFGKAA
jgi:hypothetical protein